MNSRRKALLTAQAPLQTWLVAWDFLGAAAVHSVLGGSALNLSTPAAPLQFAVASLPGTAPLAPGSAADVRLLGSASDSDMHLNATGAPGALLIAHVSINGVACGSGTAAVPPDASSTLIPAAVPACNIGMSQSFAGAPGDSAGAPAPSAGVQCSQDFCCPAVPVLAGPAGRPIEPEVGPGSGPASAPSAAAAAAAQQLAAPPAQAGVDPAPSPAAAPALGLGTVQPTASGSAGLPLQGTGQQEGLLISSQGLVAGLAAAAAAALACTAVGMCVLVRRVRRAAQEGRPDRPLQPWPTTSVPGIGLTLGSAQGPGESPASGRPEGPVGALALALPGLGAGLGASAAGVSGAVPKPQRAPPPPPHATPASPAAGLARTPAWTGGAAAEQAPKPSRAPPLPPAIAIPVSARAAWLLRPVAAAALPPPPVLTPLIYSPYSSAGAGWDEAHGAVSSRTPAGARLGLPETLAQNPVPMAPPASAPGGAPLGVRTLKTLPPSFSGSEPLARRGTWPQAALAAAAPQSPGSPWRPGSAPGPSNAMGHIQRQGFMQGVPPGSAPGPSSALGQIPRQSFLKGARQGPQPSAILGLGGWRPTWAGGAAGGWPAVGSPLDGSALDLGKLSRAGGIQTGMPTHSSPSDGGSAGVPAAGAISGASPLGLARGGSVRELLSRHALAPPAFQIGGMCACLRSVCIWCLTCCRGPLSRNCEN